MRRKFKQHYRRWKVWRKTNDNGKLYQFMVLLGVIKTPAMSYTLLPYERPTKFFYENDEFCECGEVERSLR